MNELLLDILSLSQEPSHLESRVGPPISLAFKHGLSLIAHSTVRSDPQVDENEPSCKSQHGKSLAYFGRPKRKQLVSQQSEAHYISESLPLVPVRLNGPFTQTFLIHLEPPDNSLPPIFQITPQILVFL